MNTLKFKNLIKLCVKEIVALANIKGDYLETHDSINNEIIRELCRCTKKQATMYTTKMRKENIIEMIGVSTATRYIKK
ncbi:hypothetical protein [Thomasclavelia sp.]|uniref:hypothetical protein n=1 Tax=Thomasclavelia sp. TaxID=3025757 RepID=UPI0025DF55A7|nr:hypothetical protein [Thomasclavelia sp.]